MHPIIEVKRLTKTFGGQSAVKEVSFHMAAGEIFGLLGPNGAGKSTTIMMLTTLLRPTSGHARVAGFDVVQRPDQVRLSLGYISQDVAVDDILTGRENLLLQAGFYHVPKKTAAIRIGEVLDLVGLAQRADDPVETYSGGMRKRLDIAAGLIHHPKVLFVDEPTLGLDIQTRQQIWQYFEQLREQKGMTVFLTTHYMEEADALCDRIAIIDEGGIKAIGSPGDLKSRIGAEMISIRFDASEEYKVDEALCLISGLPFVESATRSDGRCIAVVQDADAAIPEIVRAIQPSGLQIGAVTIKRPSLDDVYMTFTGKELRNQTGSREDAHRSHRVLRRMRT